MNKSIEEKTIKEISDLVHKHFEKDFPDGLVMPIKNMKEKWEREAIINYRIRFEAGVDICTKEMLKRIETGKSKEKHFVSIEEAENMVKEAIEKEAYNRGKVDGEKGTHIGQHSLNLCSECAEFYFSKYPQQKEGE